MSIDWRSRSFNSKSSETKDYIALDIQFTSLHQVNSLASHGATVVYEASEPENSSSIFVSPGLLLMTMSVKRSECAELYLEVSDIGYRQQLATWKELSTSNQLSLHVDVGDMW